MSDDTDIQFWLDADIPAYIVAMPDKISHKYLCIWIEHFNYHLNQTHNPKPLGLLIDTKRHDFESIECLRILGEYLRKDELIIMTFSNMAFVQPANHMPPHVHSAQEAYFDSCEKALHWLNQKMSSAG